MILIQKDGVQQQVPLSRLQEWTGAPFIPYLQFSHPKLLRSCIAKTRTLRKRGEVSEEQIWLGQYYSKEILSAEIPLVSLRWIDEKMGWGVFAERPFSTMEFIAEYTGIVRERKSSDATNAYCFEYTLAPEEPSPGVIDAQDQGGLSRYINHSDQPNLASALATVDDVGHIVLSTLRPIGKGEQLCYDYGSDYWKHRKSKK